ncbi:MULTISPECIES: DUF5668 domain-containing protein [Roseivirga]|uniref:LiaF transmembrane domain-containing protein n=1 Tax=Roseivirga thermotolerans TaxID=1758176 RepID=A0ABQ3I4A5_9BACT|nr:MULTISPECIES: DUF5668 domain-containing protein [Roseivirga]MEC7755075.1 DUF5668 domain-containing protein [Bacteroidota bacterium]GHE56403.1 hypothetical protein GCM10011340_09150 [Roseivirga thermotolerans]|tara:strand:- start:846 stop:1538 length:693 start_codon:yes stop_codon:yes gene_type:complete
MDKQNQNKLLGLIFIVIGIVAVLTNFDVLPWSVRHYLFQWENILILIGLFLLVTDQNRKAGTVLLIVGLILVIDDWLRIHISIWDLWPLILVFAGIHIIRRTVPAPHTTPQDTSAAPPENLIEDMAIFGGGDRVVKTKDFKGGSLTAVFGGSNIDLTTSSMQQPVATLNIFYLFGGSKIRVPKDWDVDLRVTNIFGGMPDKRIISGHSHSTGNTLVIKGLVIFGGAEISN